MINLVSSSRYKLNRKRVKKQSDDILTAKGVGGVTVNLIFVGRNKMRQLSFNYKKEDVALPVLAFQYGEENDDENLLGEIVICYPQAVLLAAERNRKVEETIINLIRHGIDNLLK
ncbi:rRNA maturation RNase YbeY [Patescibacteria group bacterium]|nr:rRNA maturation RNase YbeY [Patescibacteria group bacterium]